MFRSKSQPVQEETEMTKPEPAPAKLNPAMVSRLNEVARHVKVIQEEEEAVRETENRVLVGPGIRLKGEITDCDTLVVEGHVEITAKPRLMKIAETGTVIGDIEAKTVDVSGSFDGTLIVNERLRIRSTGRVSGNVQYNTIEIEPGGRISGSVETEEEEQKEAQEEAKQEAKQEAKDSAPVVEDASKRAEQRWAKRPQGDATLDKLVKLPQGQKNGELGAGADQSRSSSL